MVTTSSPDGSPHGDLVGSLVDGRYQIEAFVARGGMATVYRALDTRLHRVVALKIMHPSLAEDPDFVMRFEREARSAALFNHPAVVAVHDQGTDNGLVYLAMEYVDGATLRTLMTQQGTLEPAVALSVLEPALDALSSAHRAGLVHRDIKPENILISTTGQVKIADFGLARAIEDSGQSQATQGLLIGTVAYLAPEQVESGAADERTDVYAAGIILFEAVTGKTPFDGKTPLSIAYQHVNSDVPAPSTINPSIPNKIDDLVLSATAKNPADRYVDAADFARHIGLIRSTLDPDDAKTFATVVLERPINPEGTFLGEVDDVGATATIAPIPSDPALENSELDPQPIENQPNANDTSIVESSQFDQSSEPEAHLVDLESSSNSDHHNEQSSWLDRVKKPLPYRSLIAFAGVLALVLSLGGLAWQWAGAQTVPVPSIVGMSEQEASSTLASQGLGLTITGQEFSDEVSRGKIISSNPSAGDAIAKDGTVTGIASAGPESVAIPKVAKTTLSTAKGRLSALSLEATTVEEFSDTVRNGRVIESRPGAGTTVKSGSTVELVVSKGPPPVVVPNVVTMDRASAISRLQGLGLKVVIENQLPVVVIGRVYSQNPGPGTEVPKGSTVTLTLV